MPTYEYECQQCGVFELEQKITDPALTSCPTCQKCHGQMPVKRLITAPAFHLKGGGWYRDLYSSASAKSSSTEPTSKDSTNGANTNSANNSSNNGSGSSKQPCKPSGCACAE